MNIQFRDRKRIADYGEVFTASKEVNEIIYIVEHEAYRVESKFFEPACGNGNFLTEILKRKISTIEKKYAKNQVDFEKNLIISIGSLYGIDILKNNVEESKYRLEEIAIQKYKKLFNKDTKENFIKVVKYILNKNIIIGDALTLKSTTKKQKPLIFSEWASINGTEIKRKDYVLYKLLDNSEMSRVKSDEGLIEYIPAPIKEYRKVHYLDIINND